VTTVFADGLSKAQRLLELQHLFWRGVGRPLRTVEIAHRLGIKPRTVRKYLTELSATGRLPITRQGRAWTLAEGARLEVLPVRFLLEEATAVYLAARLLARTADEPNPAVASALGKLASVVPAELRGFLDHLAARACPAPEGPFAQVFRTLAYGWALSRVVELQYEPRSRCGAPLTCRFEVHLLEPGAAGCALYAIGRAEPPGELRTFKLERIRAATLTRDTFQAPALAETLARLDAAWAVWLSDGSPVIVRLRFAPEVAARVRETRWHPSQQLADLPGGGVELTLAVTSTVELRPWILGWGSLCQVLEPEALRADIATELARAAAAYQQPPSPPGSGP
jgi:predicted DNA-binding transcriptional regulator YafY